MNRCIDESYGNFIINEHYNKGCIEGDQIMKAKIFKSRALGCTQNKLKSLQIKCPACNTYHFMRIKESTRIRPAWEWNGSLDTPTLSPIVNNKSCGCYFFIRDGYIEYTDDCKHDLKGQKIELPELTDKDII